MSLPRLPLLLRLPISVCELDCDIPSKKGLRRRSTARVSGHQGPEQQLMESWVVMVFKKDQQPGLERHPLKKDTAEGGQAGHGPKDSRLSGLLSARGKNSDLYPDSWRFSKGEEPRYPDNGGEVREGSRSLLWLRKERCREPMCRGGLGSLELGLWSTKDALRLLHLRATVAGIIHLQTIIQFIQVLFHLSYLLSGYMFQPKAHLWGKKTFEFGVTSINNYGRCATLSSWTGTNWPL